MNGNLVSLPCPKCRQPNPVEAASCKCGHRFFADAIGAEENSFPSIQVALPELQLTARTTAAAAPAKRSEPSAPAASTERPLSEALQPAVTIDVRRASSIHAAPVYRELSILAESQPERLPKWRLLVPAGAIAATLAIAGAWSGYFGTIESVFGVTSDEVPVAEQPAGPTDDGSTVGATTEEADTTASDESSSTVDEQTQSEVPGTNVDEGRGPVRRDTVGSPRTAAPRTFAPAGETAVAERSASATETAPAEPRASANRATPVALCGDGTYSYSKSGDPCAQRGGVAERYTPGRPVTEVTPPEARTYILGPRGGCYYLNSSGRKVYVNKELCG
ncbi:MAG TPA: hypothetical protein PKD24_05830 [Pyrinomonadaceae bacterium]|nr:hypothetical protein [Pyrinomonadaceae bacterium]HMP65326.1 hypothetical protein [Pyrinomonadaceae bacterium]